MPGAEPLTVKLWEPALSPVKVTGLAHALACAPSREHFKVAPVVVVENVNVTEFWLVDPPAASGTVPPPVTGTAAVIAMTSFFGGFAEAVPRNGPATRAPRTTETTTAE